MLSSLVVCVTQKPLNCKLADHTQANISHNVWKAFLDGSKEKNRGKTTDVSDNFSTKRLSAQLTVNNPSGGIKTNPMECDV